MGIPQIIMIVMLALTLFVSVVEHNKPREGKYNVWQTLVGIAIQISLLTWGGFFQNIQIKGVEETMCLVTKRCEKCKYKGEVLFGEPCCDYILIAGKSRGCPAGDECDKFEEDE